jgi:hypothetical protein
LGGQEEIVAGLHRALMRSMQIGFAAAALLCAAAAANAQPAKLPMEPLRDVGQSVTGAFEGWLKNSDGSFSFLLGYYNRNLKEELDIPIGPQNKIEPGGPDQGQPTHFQPGRGWGVFMVTVPKDFGDSKLTWTLETNGQATEIPISLNPLWEISPFREEGIGNTPPVISFGAAGPSVQGPRPVSTSLTAVAGEPLALHISVMDDAKVAQGAMRPKTPPVTLTWTKFRGPGEVLFANAKPPVMETQSDHKLPGGFSGGATTTASFREPGDYILLVVANDWSGEGGRGFQCCWTNALVKVLVKARSGN